MHIRRNLLESLRTQLKTITKIGKVRIQRLAPKALAHRDVILYDTEEDTETLLIHPQPRAQNRILTVAVTGYILGQLDDEKVEADMDILALDIEKKMTTPSSADDIRLIATDKTVAEDDPSINILTLTYQLEYNTVEFGAEIAET
jgi:hypothetical protein